MDKLTRIFLALVLAGATLTASACGDDDKTSPASGDDGHGDSLGDGDDEGDTAGDGDDSTGDGGDTDGDDGKPADDCPEHPLVVDEGDFCVLGEGTMTDDLTIEPIAGKEWILEGKVVVGEDVGGEAEPDGSADAATLTIKAGSTIYGENTKLSYLVISRGSKIMAEGTADQPIVFTAFSEDKAPKSWGGIAINGRARATCGTSCESEGEAGLFGGPDDADDSGVLKYVRVEWAGFEFAPGDELNGIAFNAVGNGTEVDYIQVHYNADDGIEFFGGAVNVKHAVLTGNGDDNIDWQLGWRGKLQHALVLQAAGKGEHGIEADNVENNADLEPISDPILANVTIVGNGDSGQDGIRLRRGTRGALHSILVTGFTASCLNVNEDTWSRLDSGDLTIAGSRVDCALNYKDTPSQEDFFEAGTGNMLFTSLADELVGTDITDSQPWLKAGSDLLTGGSQVAGDAFFDQVDYIGAFDAENNWMEGWTAFPEPTVP